MALYAISDLHLPFGAGKPMNIFKGWDNYTERIFANWQRIVKPEDTVVIPGDISWALKLDQAKADFEFIDSLNGSKIISKGNHDYWWSTATKINEFLDANDFKTIKILHNNAYKVGNFSICGTRGWIYDSTCEKDEKVVLREASRLETSIKSGIELGGKPIIFLHYPFAYAEYVCDEILQVIKKYEIDRVFYGHIHGFGANRAITEYAGIRQNIVSCDCVDFTPVFIEK